jgi:hypothetical protein
MSDQKRDVLTPLPQGWNGDWKNIEAVKEIRPETALQNHLLQVLIGGGDEPNVNADGSAAANPLVFLLLQNSQELWLQLQRELSDFVEK